MRRAIYLFIAVIVLPLAILAVLELGLRVFGVGYPTSFFLKDGSKLVENQKFGWRFFPRGMARSPRPMTIAAEKPKDTFRIFIFGESAAYGDPDPAFGMPRVLEVLLRARFPDRKFEVVNVAMTAINSHVILPIARECAKREGDLWVIYMGNNEVVGPFGPGTVFSKQSPPLSVIRGTISLRRLKIAQLIQGLMERSKGEQTFTGMDMFSENRVAADDSRMARVYENFERNLRDIVAEGAGAKAPMLLCTVGTNLRDCAPFAPTSIATFTNAVLLLKSGKTNEAAKLFSRARDEDALRFRADSKENEIIRKVAGGDVKLLDIEKLLGEVPGSEYFYEHVHFNFAGNYVVARAIADQAFSGQKWLSEEECAERLGLTDFHRVKIAELLRKRMTRPPFTFQFDHAERDARAVAELKKLRAGLKPEARAVFEKAIAAWPEDWTLRELFAEFLAAQNDFAGAAAQTEKVVAQLGHHAEKWAIHGLYLLKAKRSRDAIASFARASELEPENVEAAYGRALIHIEEGMSGMAIQELKRALRMRPHFTEARMAMGEALLKEKQTNEAVVQFEKILELEPEHVKARAAVNKIRFSGEGLKTKAAELEKLAAQNPGDVSLVVLLGKALLENGQLEEAKKHFGAALQLDAANGEAHYFYGEALAREKRTAEALEHFIKAAQLLPNDFNAHLNLGVALAQNRRFAEALVEFEAALKIQPGNEMALEYASKARGMLRR